MIVKEYTEKNKKLDNEGFVVKGCQMPDKVYRHSENFKNDISFLMATDELTVEDLMKIFFEGVEESGD